MNTVRMLLPMPLWRQHKHVVRAFYSTPRAKAKKRQVVDESTLAGAQHKISLSGPSLGHLISELSATRPGMEALRQEGQTMSEEHRTLARRIAKWVVGVPFAFGTIVVGANRVQS